MLSHRHQSHYPLEQDYDEMFDPNMKVRSHYEQIYQHMMAGGTEILNRKKQFAERRMLEEGITFTLYQSNEPEPLERTIPFDIIPRVIASQEWSHVEKGMKQRVTALNCFLHDIYHEQRILRDRVIPRQMVVANRYYRHEMMGIDVPGGAYITTAGIDLVRDHKGQFYVLEDNLRTPSGFSYLFKTRTIMKELYPDLIHVCEVCDVEQSLNDFLSTLRSLAPNHRSDPTIALLTPGQFNSAFYEHAFLAQQMGIHLVEGRDLVYKDHKIYMRGIGGLRQVDVIYRRLDDDYLDPLAFLPESLLGVAGIMNAYRAGNINIVNAPGTGVADDKAVYAFVPDMIRYYLGEEPIIPNVPTYILSRKKDREYVLDHLPSMVVKETSLSGGYGMLVGPAAEPGQLRDFADRIKRNPERYIAQPTIRLSQAPVLVDGQLTPRHIDLRAFALLGANNRIHVIPGGLTRVALKKGSRKTGD
jgi:uncharacterized circularly permuted ATP-grasp superfamily protein